MKKALLTAAYVFAVTTANAEAPNNKQNAQQVGSSNFTWTAPSNREEAVERCSSYISFVKPMGAKLSGKDLVDFGLNVEIAEALLKHLQGVQKKRGFRGDAKRCKAELLKAEKLLKRKKIIS